MRRNGNLTEPAGRGGDAAAVAFLLLLTSFFWGRLLFGGLVFSARDLGFFFAPLRAAFARTIQSGSAPLWNPWIGCGNPMAADPNNSAFFPATLLFLLRPFSRGLRAFSAVWVFALPLFSYAGLRRLRLPPLASAASAGAVAICGPAMTLACLPSTAWAWVFFFPLLSIAGGAGEAQERSIGFAGVLFALVILAGEPAIAVQILFALAVFSFDRRRPLSSMKLPVAAAILGALIAAPQVVGALELLPQTARGSGLPAQFAATFHSVRPLRVLEFLWPGLFGDPNSPLEHGFWGAEFFDAGGAYVDNLALGTAALLLAPAAWGNRRGKRFLILAVAAVVFSFGRFLPGGSLLFGLPGFSLLRYPEKWLLLAAFSLLGAAGCALASISSGDTRARRTAFCSAAVVLAFSAAAGAALRFFPAGPSGLLELAGVVDRASRRAGQAVPAELARETLQVALFGLLCAAVLAARRRISGRRASLLLAALLFLDLIPRTMNWLPLSPRSYYDSVPGAVASLDPASGRLYFAEETSVALDPLRPLAGIFFGFEYAGNNDIDRFSPRRSFLFGRELAGLPSANARATALLRLADVAFVSTLRPPAETDAVLASVASTSGERSVVSLSGGRRFRLFPKISTAGSELAARRRLLAADFDPEREAVLEASLISSNEGGVGRIRPGLRLPDRESVDVESPGPALLLRSETFEPRWRATIDGAFAKVLPADFSFQGVVVPPGRHRIDFVYRDRAMTAALFVSLVALALPAGLLRLRRKSILPARGPASRSEQTR